MQLKSSRRIRLIVIPLGARSQCLRGDSGECMAKMAYRDAETFRRVEIRG